MSFSAQWVSSFAARRMTPSRRFLMRDDSMIEATAARKAYEARPWLKHYSGFMQPEITPRFANGLDMFLEIVKTMPEQAAMYYFDRAISYGELDRASSALAVALKQRGVRYGDR